MTEPAPTPRTMWRITGALALVLSAMHVYARDVKHLVQATLGHALVATTGRYLHAQPTDSSARYLAV